MLLPRTPSGFFRNRPAAQAKKGDPKGYYSINFYHSAIDAVVQDLKLRFGPHQQRIVCLVKVVPSHLASDNSISWEENFARCPITSKLSL